MHVRTIGLRQIVDDPAGNSQRARVEELARHLICEDMNTAPSTRTTATTRADGDILHDRLNANNYTATAARPRRADVADLLIYNN